MTAQRPQPPQRPARDHPASSRWYSETYLRSDYWRAFRSEMLREQPQCSICSSRDGLEVHHLSYARLGREQARDVIVLCRACHRERHHEGITLLAYENRTFEPVPIDDDDRAINEFVARTGLEIEPLDDYLAREDHDPDDDPV